jgi:hypothetical protein
MRRLRRLAVDLRTVVNNTRGQDLIEYALVNSVIILACVQLGKVRWMKPQLQEAFSADYR